MKKQFRSCPVIDQERKTIRNAIDLDQVSRVELINILTESKDDYNFQSDYDGGVWLVTTRIETDEEYDKRIENETKAQEQWQKEYAVYLQEREEEKRQRRLAQEADRAKFKDPDYIEFLRVQAKMKEKGYIQ